MSHPIKVLLVEDNPADVELTREALGTGKLHVDLDVVTDGAAALDYLNRTGSYRGQAAPNMIILDLNVPRVSGRDVLAFVKSNEHLKRVPIVILTSSAAETDVAQSYDLGANCYVTKPLDFGAFQNIVTSLETFWFTVVCLPTVDKDAS